MPPNTPQVPPSNMMGGVQSGYPGSNPLMTPPKKPLNVLLIIVVILSFLFMLVAGFAAWAFSSRQDYKSNVEAKIDTAVELAKQETATQKDKEFVEKEKIPHRSYKTSDILGSISFDYPKTWSAFVVEEQNTNSGTPIDGYFHPNFVPNAKSGVDYALRVQVISRPYSDTLAQFDGKVKQGHVKISPYKAPKVQSVLGVRIQGEINKGQQDTMVMLPVRDKTLQIWTESNQFVPDFDNIVLSTLTFVP